MATAEKSRKITDPLYTSTRYSSENRQLYTSLSETDKLQAIKVRLQIVLVKNKKLLEELSKIGENR